jgi:uncharacterized protein (TIGR02246 family)
MTTLEDRVQRLEDRAAIQDLLHAYARCADTKDWEGFADLFTDDGYLVLPFGKLEKKDMVRAVAAVLSPWQATQHLFANVAIAIDGDHATTNHYLQATHVLQLENTSEHADIGGWYDNTCRRTAEGWKLVSVDLTFIWHDGVPFVPGNPEA